MPLVRISATDDHDAASLDIIGNGVHEAMVATIDVPEADRFQIITARKRGELMWDRTFLGVERSDSAIFIEITLAPGRELSKKRALYKQVIENLERDAHVRPQDVLIVLVETARENWSFGNGIAHFAPA
jgi:phenylpyruvate tautomerase PptA (4-oxalocrotonate tautomerase family)